MFFSADFYKSIFWGEVDFCTFLFSTSLQSIFIILLLKGPFHVLKSFYTGSQPDPKRSFQQPSLAGSPSPLAFSFLLIVFHCLLGLCSCFSPPHYLINIQIPLSCLLSLMKHHNILVFGFLPELKLKYEQWAGFFLCFRVTLQKIIAHKCLTTSVGLQPLIPSCPLNPTGRHFKQL